MSSGRRFLQTNTRERAISPDLNRIGLFAAVAANEMARGQMLRPIDDTAYVGVTLKGPGPANTVAIDVDSNSSPLYGVVIDGLMVVVPAAGTSFLVTPGEALIINPDTPALVDDSPAKLVQAPGIDSAGVLNWNPNPGPGLRIDVIECQRIEEVVETDNRDIFNPATGLFTPQAVTKVTRGNFAYRVREGVAGGGLPLPATGWLPLAIVATPAGAVDLDTCTIWDVRWLASDMTLPYSMVRPFDSRTLRRKWFNDQRTAPGELRLSGQSLANYLGFKIGGLFWEMSSPGQLYIDLNNPLYQAAGFAPIPSAPYFVYSLWPGRFVRWVRYYQTPTASQGGRIPGAFRGIPTVSHVQPLLGVPIVPISPSPLWGLGVSTQLGRTVASGVVDLGGVLRGGVDDGDLVHLQFQDDASVPYATVSAVIAGNTAEWTLLPGVYFPAGTNRLRVGIALVFASLPSPGDNFQLTWSIDLWNPSTTNSYVNVYSASKTVIQTASVAPVIDTGTIDIPVGGDGLSVTGPLVFRGDFSGLDGNAPAPALVSALLTIEGWDSP